MIKHSRIRELTGDIFHIEDICPTTVHKPVLCKKARLYLGNVGPFHICAYAWAILAYSPQYELVSFCNGRLERCKLRNGGVLYSQEQVVETPPVLQKRRLTVIDQRFYY